MLAARHDDDDDIYIYIILFHFNFYTYTKTLAVGKEPKRYNQKNIFKNSVFFCDVFFFFLGATSSMKCHLNQPSLVRIILMTR